MADFNFYVNRQGIRGRKGEQGEQGFSPIISVKTQTANEYVLTVQNEDGSFDSPNLRGNAITNNGGTYIRYNPDTEEMYTGYADMASYDAVGEVQFATYAQLENGGAEQLGVTSMDVYDFVNAKISETDAFTFDKLAHTLIEGSNITLTVDDENETITINADDVDLSSCVKTTGDQTISGHKTFLNSPILKGTTSSVLDFYNGNNDTEVAKLQYSFDNNRFTISSEGGMYLQTSNNSINVDTLLTSASLENYVTTNTPQTITSDKTFSGDLHLSKGTHIYIQDATPLLERIQIFGRSSNGNNWNDLVLRSFTDIQFELTGNGGTTNLTDIRSAMTLANSAVQPADIAALADTSLSNLSTTGEKRLHALKGYMDELEQLSDSEGYNDYVNNLHSTFNSTNFTAKNSAIITSDGIASNWGRVTSPEVIVSTVSTSVTLSASKIFVLEMDFVYKASATFETVFATNAFAGGEGTRIIRLGKNHLGDLVAFYPTAAGLRLNASEYSPTNNETLKIKLTYNPTTSTDNIILQVTKADGTTYTKIQSSSMLVDGITTVYWGSNSSGQEGYQGSIDLKYVRITNGSDVISGNITGIDVHTINNTNISIPYVETIQGDRIADIQYLAQAQQIYEATGNCDEVILDQTNQVYYLPAGSVYGKINRLNNSIGDIGTILDSINGEAI